MEAFEQGDPGTEVNRAAGSVEESGGPYTLSIVFCGVVSLVPELDAQGNPKKLWALITDLTSPRNLPDLPCRGTPYSFQDVPRHEGRLYFPEGNLVSAEGHAVLEATRCGKTERLKYVRLEDLHWSLDAFSSQTELEIDKRPIVPPVPLSPDQEESFNWAIQLDEIAKFQMARSQKPKLQNDLFDEYYLPNRPRWLSSRFTFDRGRLWTRELSRDSKGNCLIAKFPVYDQGNCVFYQAIPSEIAISLVVRGDVKLLSRPLDGVAPNREPVVLSNRGDTEVVVYVENEPNAYCDEVAGKHCHFGVFYSLFADTGQLSSLPEPRPPMAGFPVLNVQCSPVGFSRT